MIKRMFFGMGLAIGLTSTVSAQELGFPGEVVDAPVLTTGVEGGFGMDYIQPPPVAGIPGNRWSMLGGPSYFEGIPFGAELAEASPFLTAPPVEMPAEAVPPAAVPPAAAQAARGRRDGRRPATLPPPYGTPLPQTRLYGADMAAPPMYAPFNRHQTYGAAYGMGPYGSNYYSGFWHGRPVYP